MKDGFELVPIVLVGQQDPYSFRFLWQWLCCVFTFRPLHYTLVLDTTGQLAVVQKCIAEMETKENEQEETGS